MVKALFVLNALLTFPFGVLALAIPSALFAKFGLQLNASGELVARGYGATLVAYGVVLFLSRQATDHASTRTLLLSMVLFNAIEAVIQGIAGVRGFAATVIFGNVALHAVVAVLCAFAFLAHKREQPKV